MEIKFAKGLPTIVTVSCVEVTVAYSVLPSRFLGRIACELATDLEKESQSRDPDVVERKNR